MGKKITNGELAEIVTGLLVGRLFHDHLDAAEKYAAFMTDIAKVICDHCGGEVTGTADPCEGWLVGITGNESLPEDGGVWKDYDPDGDLFDQPACSFCEHDRAACEDAGVCAINRKEIQSVDVLHHPKISEDELSNYFAAQIEDGHISPDEIAVKLARYGLMDPSEFAIEMQERIEMSKEDT